MKKVLYLLLVLLSFAFITGCYDNNSNHNENEIPELSGVTFEDATFVYSEYVTYSIYVSNSPDGFLIVYVGNEVKEVGTYNVTAKIFDLEGNLMKELTATITIVEDANANDNKNDVELPLV